MYMPTATGANYQKQLEDLMSKSKQLQGQFISPYNPPVIAPHIDYVHGLDGAKQFLDNMPAGGKAVLMDEDEAKFYVVSKDANGTPAQIAFAHFTLEFEEQQKDPGYVTLQDFEAFKKELKQMLGAKNESDHEHV